MSSTRRKSDPQRTADERVRRAVRQLRRSGRRLVRSGGGWAVVACGAVVGRLRAEEVEALVADGRLVEAEGGGMVLCAADMVEATAAEDAPAGGAWVFAAAGLAVVRAPSGRGFERMAHAAAHGRGPLTLRAVAAGVRLVRDAEQSVRARGLTMDWSGAVADRRKRGPVDGGMSGVARAAAAQLAKLQAVLAPDAFRVAWLACVERRTLAAIAREMGGTAKTVRTHLARALEQLADAYDA